MKTVLIEINGDTKELTSEVKEDTMYVLAFTGNNSAEFTFTALFDTPGVSAEIIGLFYLRNTQSLKLVTVTDHKVKNTSCITKVQGVLDDASSSDYLGKIIIEKPAAQTSSFLQNKTLVLGNKTKNTSQPILEIEADDVRASHGSTTGKIDETQLYYLLSRGLDRKEAESIIVRGFFESVLNEINDATIKEKLMNALLNYAA